ncbi:MAG: helix-turn-helix transcriptional regulator [Alcaligenaceae bacterium]|nr:MAG: helix-turn-helix transcriptional regulator [Alcaligenaceae bacterium]
MELSALSQILLDAAVDPRQWATALSALARYGNAKGAALLPIEGRLPSRVLISPELEGAFNAYFSEQWQLRDERERALPKMRRTGISTDQDFVTDEQLKRSDYYNAYLARHDINWSACLDVRSGSDEWALIVERGNRFGHFELGEQERLLQLLPAVKQAVALSQHLAYANVIGVADAFDLIGGACILVNRFGKLFRANKSAELYFGNGLTLTGSELSCVLPAETAALRRLVLSLCMKTDETLLRAPRSMVVHRALGRPFILQAIRLSGMVSEVFSPAHVLMFIVDPFADRSAARAEELRSVFGLTQAEAQLLLKLKNDISLSVAAEKSGITYETARTHLKRIMQKTQSTRQAEVLSIVQRMSGGLVS